MRKHILRVLALLLVIAIAVFAWFAWPDKARQDVAAVAGARPDITAPREQVIPTVKTAKPIGWAQGQTPTAAAGLRVAAFATGLDHPRWLYRLPNGDVLVAETNSPPRKGGGITGWVMRVLMGRVGAGVP
ncbi:hypothetical protein LTR94_033134, partial [Friedmanniomyces endolithicus]